jgi:hypothetical protein
MEAIQTHIIPTQDTKRNSNPDLCAAAQKSCSSIHTGQPFWTKHIFGAAILDFWSDLAKMISRIAARSTADYVNKSARATADYISKSARTQQLNIFLNNAMHMIDFLIHCDV